MTTPTDTPTVEQPPQGSPEVRTYIGRRFNEKISKVVHAWLYPDGSENWWSKLYPSHASVGTEFTFTVLPDGKVYTSGERGPKYAARVDDPEKLAVWTALDRAAEGQLELVRLKRGLAKEGGEFAAALAPIKQALREARNRNQRAAIIAAVMIELGVYVG